MHVYVPLRAVTRGPEARERARDTSVVRSGVARGHPGKRKTQRRRDDRSPDVGFPGSRGNRRLLEANGRPGRFLTRRVSPRLGSVANPGHY